MSLWRSFLRWLAGDKGSISGCMFVFVVAGLVGVSFHASGSASTALLWALACLGSGITVGFLFGIPRTLQSEHDQANYSQRVNTNLEQISDWLTKILVGLGLTQLDKVGAKLGEAAAYIAPGLGTSAHGEIFASALIVYFSIVGFMSGYLLTRLVLAPAFWRADTGSRLAEVERKIGQVDIDTDVNGALDFIKEPNHSHDVLQEFIRKLEKARSEFPLRRDVNIVLARLYNLDQQRDKSIKTLTAFLQANDPHRSTQDSAAAHYNLACYFSLDYGDTEDEQKKKLLLVKAVEHLKAAFLKDPHNIEEAEHDPELEPIRETPEFKELAGHHAKHRRPRT